MIDEKLPQGQEKARVVEDMFDRIAPRYDLLNRMLTFRMDVAWRRVAVNSLQLLAGARVLDLACGTGDLCRALTAATYQPIGADFSAGMLAASRTDAPLVRADAMHLPFADRALDGVTCGFALRNFVDLAPVIAECARVLRPKGRIALVDVSEPTSAPARRGPLRVVPARRAARRRAALRPPRVRVPPRIDRIPPAAAATSPDRRRRRLRRRRAPHARCGRGATDHGNSRMTPHSDTRLASAGAALAARSELLPETDHLLDHLGAGGATWLDGERGFVTAGIAAIVHPAEAVAMLRTIAYERDAVPAGVVGPRGSERCRLRAAGA